MRKKELIDNVVARAGIKKKDAKPVIEAMLAELGETLASGRSLILPPLGRLRINREKKLANGRVMVVKLRQNDAPLKAVPAPKPETGSA
ncbi:HU family DNA-binding protein [Roseobacter sp. YSTF-M11]|uniref:HU family DNA-binding protein n=2 Tax=Roseobacter insulae TaxID=2859783 RepID=A0A9X1K3J0_9RHOB|nr:HU family DNA-binding protein [Roseobacter insulae]